MGLLTLGTRSVGFLSRPSTDDRLPIVAPLSLVVMGWHVGLGVVEDVLPG